MFAEPISNCKAASPSWWHPPIGVFVALLGALGVLVPWFRGRNISRRERAFWTFCMFLFVVPEIRTIYLEQVVHDEEQALARCQQLESSKKIADGIE